MIQYGSYTFSGEFYIAEDPTRRNVSPAPLARAHGGRIVSAYAQPKKVAIRGGMMKQDTGPNAQPSGLTLRARLDALKAALAAGPANLITDSRYYRAMHVSNYSEGYDPSGNARIATVQIDFESGDPFGYAVTGASDTWSAPANGATRTITTAGNAPCVPVYSFTVGGSGAQTIAWTLTNAATGESMSLAGNVTGGQVIVVDTLNETVKIGGVSQIALFDGRFVSLAVGSNVLTLGVTGGSVGQIATAWNDRYW